MNIYIFHWKSKDVSVINGNTIQEAFKKARGVSLSDLHHYKEIQNSILDKDVIFNAFSIWNSHSDDFKRGFVQDNTSFPPSTKEDKNSPSIWKYAHWKWFFETHK